MLNNCTIVLSYKGLSQIAKMIDYLTCQSHPTFRAVVVARIPAVVVVILVLDLGDVVVTVRFVLDPVPVKQGDAAFPSGHVLDR